jgi:hypothetical protein
VVTVLNFYIPLTENTRAPFYRGPCEGEGYQRIFRPSCM